MDTKLIRLIMENEFKRMGRFIFSFDDLDPTPPIIEAKVVDERRRHGNEDPDPASIR